MKNPIFIADINIHPGWTDFLTTEIIDILLSIENELLVEIENNDLCPTTDKVLRFLNISPNEIKVVILGQDPYPQKGVATGRAFEVFGISSWKSSFRNPSLQNIIRSVFFAKTEKILKFNDIRKLLDNAITIFPPNKIFNSWEEQGVLLLNTALTCKVNTPGSHAHLWKEFTESLIKYIHLKQEEAYWFIWGNHALEAIASINPKNILFSYHPSRCHQREDDFLYGKINCFKETSYLVDWIGYKELQTLF